MNRRETLAAKLHTETLAEGGCTLFANGERANHTHGWVVGGRAGISVVVREDATVDHYVKALKALEAALGHPPVMVGTWTHDGQVYVDESTWHREYMDAAVTGRIRGELAIWNVAGQRSLLI